MVTVYYMKYALTSGITVAEITAAQHTELLVEGHIYTKLTKGCWGTETYHKKDFAFSKEDAITRFKELKTKRVESLQRQVRKLEALEPKFNNGDSNS